MYRFSLFLFLPFLFSSCQKIKEKIDYTDYSIQTQYDFTKAIFVGENAILIGGEHFNVSMIYQLEKNGQINEIKIENEDANKQLTCISQSGNGTLIAGGYNGKILYSLDSGVHWNFVQNDTWLDILGIDFYKNDSAYFVGGTPFHKGEIASVDYLGKGERTAQQDFEFVVEDIRFLSNGIAYLCGYGAVMKSENRGKNWEFLDVKNDYFKAMAWANEQEGVVVGYEGSIVQTQDGGRHWHTIRNGNNPLQTKMRWKDVANNGNALYVAVGENGAVMMSTNRGKNWSSIRPFTKKDLNGVCFKNENECLLVGESGSVFLLHF
ncbi:MAG TPA: YCF48-related protein [Chitinophagaceae bacterium]|nr:YCF48-related protein [Chitinophagaceae bacterium]